MALAAVALLLLAVCRPLDATLQIRRGRHGGRGVRRQLQSSCAASPLQGFQYSTELQQGLLLHWTPYHASLSFALEAQAGSGAEKGWLSVGWSPYGTMAGSDAVVGNLPGGAVQTWFMADYTQSSFSQENLALGKTGSAMTSNGTFVWFSRLYSDGQAPITTSTPSNLVYAYSADNTQTFAYHGGNYGSVYVDLLCGKGLPAATAPPSSLPPPSPVSTTYSPPPLGSNPSPPPSGTLSPFTPPPSSPAFSSSSGCTPSSLAGFTCSVQLSGSSFILHWRVLSSNKIAFAADVATTGWVSIGWSPNGRMPGSDAAVGNLPAGSLSNGAAVGAFSMAGYSLPSISPSSQFAVANSSVTVAGGRTVMRFSRSLGDGSVALSSNGANVLVWAYSPANSQTFANHGPNRGSASINFASGQSSVSSASSDSTVFFWHGLLLSIAFCVLMPAAILVARICLADVPRNQPPAKVADSGPFDSPRSPSFFSAFTAPQEHRDFWYLTHKYLQLFAVGLAFVGFLLPFLFTGTRGMQFSHGQLGMAVMVLFLLQPLVGLLRPDRSSKQRPAWFFAHWAVGMSCVTMGWLNTFFGLDLYGSETACPVQAYVIIIAVAISIMAVVYAGFLLVDISSQIGSQHQRESCVNLREEVSEA